jgi:hypothetical protein
LFSPYEPTNIYDEDETALFFRALPTKSLLVKGEKSIGGVKCSKKNCLIVWEYGERNGEASCDWKSSKTKIFQEPRN